MSIIAISNQKGGCAKTTIAVHLACWLAKKKKKVCLVDADPQKSASTWINLMGNPLPVETLSDASDLIEQIPVLAETTDFVIVDAAAGNSESGRAILFTADVCIIPIQPTGLDLHSAGDAVRLVKQAHQVRGGLPKTGVFISRATKGTRLKNEALTILGQIPAVTLLKTVIHQKQAIADAFSQELCVWDIRGGTESAKEFDQLFKEILRLAK